jgi:hypothetical protein
MAANRREKEKQKRRKADAADLYKKMTESGGGESTCLKVPEGYEEFKPEAGTYELDVMDFVAGERNKHADPGFLIWQTEFWQHWVPSMDGKNRPYVCLNRWGEKCPACERARSPRQEDEEKFTNNLKGKTMHVMLVRLLSKDGKALGEDKFRLWTTNHYNKGKGLMEQLMELYRYEENRNFSDWHDGKTLRIVFKEDTWPGGKYVLASRIDFVKRARQYDDSVEEKLCCPDDLLIRKTYRQLKNAVEFGTEEGQEEDAPPPARPQPALNGHKPSPPPEEEDDPAEETAPEVAEGDFVLHDEHGRCEVVKLQRGGLATLEDKRGRKHKDVPLSECDSLAEPEEEDEPPPPPKGKAAKKAEPEEDEWETVDDGPEEDDEPPARKPAKRR